MKALKCCICQDTIDLSSSSDPGNYPCHLPDDKANWVCSELCEAIALDEMKEGVDQEVLDLSEVSEKESVKKVEENDGEIEEIIIKE
ncbi:MAG: hypothetical protein A2Y82_04190 [Candidatus Buchananbacteria bacterium RBG_13_36_9]|uniref:Uncharacterized protein n=1 Tax=Candidatus Buchananbacteria bacterium RBG_13_36_9 TaxID=1797530 RepID=A0A1G1XR20_9BACT|nr:MAG: hypothetical protein A2Y82_04190 [Candidatus Buchananbacteria bacterium RBG_13_36_9]